MRKFSVLLPSAALALAFLAPAAPALASSGKKRAARAPATRVAPLPDAVLKNPFDPPQALRARPADTLAETALLDPFADTPRAAGAEPLPPPELKDPFPSGKR